MRWPGPRIGLRWLMVVVAMVALAFAGWDQLRRRRAYAERMASRHDALFMDIMTDPDAIFHFGKYKHLADEQSERGGRWLEAARRPWLPFPDDPDRARIDAEWASP